MNELMNEWMNEWMNERKGADGKCVSLWILRNIWKCLQTTASDLKKHG